MNTSMRWRILLPFLALILIVVAAATVFSTRSLREFHLSQTEKYLAGQANLAADLLRGILPNAQAGTNLQTEVARQAAVLGARVTVINPEGVVLADSDDDPAQMDNHATRPEVLEALRSGTGSSVRFSHTLGIDMLYTAVAVREGENLLGFVRLALPLTQLDAAVARLRVTWLAFAAGIALTAALLAVLVSDRITRPLRELTQAARRISTEGGYSPAPEPGKVNEVDSLTRTFNIMSLSIREKIKRLEEEKGKLNAILQEMSDGVIVVDGSNVVHVINRAAIKMFEVANEDPVGKNLIEVIRQHRPVELLESAKSSGLEQTLTFEIARSRQTIKGTAIPTSTFLPGMFLLIFQDLTIQTRTETMRRDFVTNVSHELRNPLAVIKMLSETLQDGALQQPDLAQKFLSQIESEADSINAMVTELLDLSKIESGRFSLDVTAVQPLAPLRNVLERLSLPAQKKDLILTTESAESLPLISADAARLEQVLMNLIHNAIKFSHPGGVVKVVVKPSGNYVLYEVHDQGIGISAENLPHVFERFFKSDKSRGSAGTGLGLSLAKHLVELHGGKLDVTSALGEGSVFTFSIPVFNPSLT